MQSKKGNKCIVITGKLSVKYDSDGAYINGTFYGWEDMPFAYSWNFLILAWAEVNNQCDIDQRLQDGFNILVKQNNVKAAYDFLCMIVDTEVNKKGLFIP